MESMTGAAKTTEIPSSDAVGAAGKGVTITSSVEGGAAMQSRQRARKRGLPCSE